MEKMNLSRYLLQVVPLRRGHDFQLHHPEGLWRLWRAARTHGLDPAGPPSPNCVGRWDERGGKTTLLDAVQLVLYGSRARCSGRGKLAYREYLRAMIHRGADPAEGAAIELRFQRSVDGETKNYRVIRSWCETAKGIEEKLDVFLDSQPDRDLAGRWDEYIENYIPNGIAHLYFFDAEQIKELADGEHTAAILGSAIHTLLGLDLVEQLETDLVVLERRKRTEAKSGEAANQLRHTEGELDRMKQLLETARRPCHPNRRNISEGTWRGACASSGAPPGGPPLPRPKRPKDSLSWTSRPGTLVRDIGHYEPRRDCFMSGAFEHVFAAVRGEQAGHPIFVSMCPLQTAAKLFQFDEESVPKAVRNRRTLNEDQVARIARYLISNPRSYVLPPLLVSVDAKVRFVSLEGCDELGHLHVPMSAPLVVNAGEHELAAVERVLEETPQLRTERIPVVFQPDEGLKRCSRIYSDLKRLTVRADSSWRLLHAEDDHCAALVRELVVRAKPFRGLVEVRHSTLSPRSRMLFTLSAVYQGTKALLARMEARSRRERLDLAVRFWNVVEQNLPEWRRVRSGKMLSSELRASFIHAHGLALQALGRAGNALLLYDPGNWESRLKNLRDIDWRRENAQDWEGRALIAGRVSKAFGNVLLTGSLIKRALEVPLLPAEEAAERAFKAKGATR